MLNLFGYTGLATLSAAATGTSVTHVDASQKAMAWARENQALSGLADRPIRWLIDDALKFVRREVRRDARYDGLIIDPPKFGRGPKGDCGNWRNRCRNCSTRVGRCSARGRCSSFSLCTRSVLSAVGLQYLLEPVVGKHRGVIEVGEMGVAERGAGRVLSRCDLPAVECVTKDERRRTNQHGTPTMRSFRHSSFVIRRIQIRPQPRIHQHPAGDRHIQRLSLADDGQPGILRDLRGHVR